MGVRRLLLGSVALFALCAEPSQAEQTVVSQSEIKTGNNQSARDILPSLGKPVEYAISITPNIKDLSFAGTARITFDLATPSDHLDLNAADLIFISTTLDGLQQPVRTTVDAKAERVTFYFPRALPPGRYTLQTTYTGKIYETSAGLFVTVYNVNGASKTMLATQFEAGDARRLAPLWDEPAYKAVFKMDIVVPPGQNAISNMPVAEKKQLPDGNTRFSFQPTQPMSSYLLFLAMGELERLTTKVDSVEVGIVTKAGDKDKGQYALESTRELLKYFNDYFDTSYPLPKLDQFALPGAGGFGAMENWGAILYFEQLLLLDPLLSSASDKQEVFLTVAHETAHQWFGNLVTMAWWDDLWLNEGFAAWMEHKASEHLYPAWNTWIQAMDGRNNAAMALDAFASTHAIIQPIANINQANLAFDAITYQKGKAVIRMLESYLGEDKFRQGVRAYIKKHAYGNATTDDLWQELEQASNIPVSQIAHDFTKQPGIPLIIAEGARCLNGQTQIQLRQDRFGADKASRQPLTWQTPVVARIVGSSESKTTLVNGRAALTVPGCGPVQINSGYAGYYRTLYAPALFKELKASFAQLPAIDQLGLLQDTWALGSADYSPLTNYFDLLQNLNPQANPLIWQQALGFTNKLVSLYKGRPTEALFRDYARTVLKPVFSHVGWDAKPDEPDNVKVLRENLLWMLAVLDDPDIVSKAQSFYAAPTALPADLRETILKIVALHGDSTTWDRLRDQAKNATTPLEKRQYLRAMAVMRDLKLAQKSLDLFLSEQTPKQLTPRLIEAVASQHPDLAWSFFLSHRDQIEERFDTLQKLSYAAGIAATSSNRQRAADLITYAEKNLPADSRIDVNKAIDTITANANLRADTLPAVDQWLAQKHSLKTKTGKLRR